MAACWSRANIRQRLPGKPRAHTAGGRPSSSLGVKSLTLGGQDLWNRERPCGTYASAGGRLSPHSCVRPDATSTLQPSRCWRARWACCPASIVPLRFSVTIQGQLPMAREQRKLAAILAADVVGYSRPMGRDESGTLARLAAPIASQTLAALAGPWANRRRA